MIMFLTTILVSSPFLNMFALAKSSFNDGNAETGASSALFELLEIFTSFIEDFVQHLYDNVSSIPFTISFSAAVLLTTMYFVSLISTPILKALVIPAWFFTIITHFFPSLIPKEYEFLSLIIFGAMLSIAIVIWKQRRRQSRIQRRARTLWK